MEPHDLEAAIDALYAGSLESFTESRNRLAKALKSTGHRAAAERVRALRKPSVSAWVVNQLWWEARAAVEALFSISARLKEAHETGHRLVAIANERRRSLDDALSRARAILERHDKGATMGILRRIATTLEAFAAASDPHALGLGRLTDDLDPPGFDALSMADIRGPLERDVLRGATPETSEGAANSDSVSSPDSRSGPDSRSSPGSTSSPDFASSLDSVSSPNSRASPRSTSSPDSVSPPNSRASPRSTSSPDSVSPPGSTSSPDVALDEDELPTPGGTSRRAEDIAAARAAVETASRRAWLARRTVEDAERSAHSAETEAASHRLRWAHARDALAVAIVAEQRAHEEADASAAALQVAQSRVRAMIEAQEAAEQEHRAAQIALNALSEEKSPLR